MNTTTALQVSPPGAGIDSAILADWLPAYVKSQPYASLIAQFGLREGSITSAEETALLYALIGRLRPEWTLEIGTFFAKTTQIMAQAITDAGIKGKIITLDPFGTDRVPGILKSWPRKLSAVTEFKPMSSMQYFLELETARTPKGSGSPLKLVFVDGHHNFEYALFDIIRSADHLTPGGAIMVDNMEQEGPKMAAITFLKWNPAWHLFYKGNLISSDTVDEHSFGSEHESEWGILLAPEGLQVARNITKLMKRNIPYIPLHALTFNLHHVSHPGTLNINVSYYAVPYDFHITGKGLLHVRDKLAIAVASHLPSVTAILPSPLTLDITRQDINVCYEIELSYESYTKDNAWVLLDAKEPLTLQS